MVAEILVASVACIGTVIGSGLGVVASNKLVSFRLDQLEKRVEDLCSLVGRVAIIEHDTASLQRKIEDLEEQST